MQQRQQPRPQQRSRSSSPKKAPLAPLGTSLREAQEMAHEAVARRIQEAADQECAEEVRYVAQRLSLSLFLSLSLSFFLQSRWTNAVYTGDFVCLLIAAFLDFALNSMDETSCLLDWIAFC